MKPLPLLAALVALAVAGFAWFAARDAGDVNRARAAGEDDSLARLATATENMTKQLERLESRVAAIEHARDVEVSLRQAAPAAAPASLATAGSDDAARSVADSRRAGDESAAADFDLAAAIGQLGASSLSRAEEEALWQQIGKLGLVDQAIDLLEERIEEQPSNPDLRLDLANAFLQKLFESRNPAEQGQWATKMDACYDEALRIDSEHWEAQFNKAISYSFWPAVTGKPAESVAIFDRLVAQQERRGDHRPEYAQTYLLLGNLYKQQGKSDLAKQTYAKGAKLYPLNEDLGAAAGQ
jgi:tetratricopeptide (TPR) repeat protein